MIKFTSAVTIAFAVLLFACSKNDEKPSEHLLTIDGTKYPALQSDNWFFLSDQSGKPISSVHVTKPELFYLDGTTQDDSVSLTWIQNYGTATVPNLIVQTFGAIAVHTAITLSRDAQPDYKGTAMITVTSSADTPNTRVTVTSPYVFTASDPFTAPYTATVALYADTSSVVITGYSVAAGNTFKAIHGVKVNDQLSVDYADLKPFSNLVTLPASTQSANLNGIRAGGIATETKFSDVLNFPDGAYPRQAGYLPGYDSYYQNYSTYADNVFTDYQKLGSVNLNPSFPDVSATKSGVTFPHPAISISRAVATQHFSFAQNSVANWHVYSPYAFQVELTELPTDVAAAYPTLSLSQLTFVGADFTEPVSGWSYQSLLQTVFTGELPDAYEYYEYQTN